MTRLMHRKLALILAALALFAMGMVADRIVIYFSDAGSNSRNDAAGKLAIKGEGSRASESSRKHPQSQAATGKDEQQVNQSGRENKDPLPQSLREALKALELDGVMDSETANRLLSQAPAGRARNEFLHRLANHWAGRNPEAAVAWANELQGSDRRHALESALHRWFGEDPAAASNYVTQMPASEQNLHLVHALAYQWAERDQAAAMEWAWAQTNPAKRERSMGGVVSSWSNTEPEAAAEFAASIESQFERNRVLDVAARRWASKDTVQALEWAGGLPGADRQRATHAILREVAESDPSLAGAIYQNLTAALPAETLTREYRHMAQEIASIWSSSNPREAAVWAVQLPEPGELRRSAVASVVDHWLQIDPVTAGEWILQISEGRTRDAATERVVHKTMQSDPAFAFQWASNLGDQGNRTGLMREVLNRWKASDPVSAQAALSAANISSEQRSELGKLFGEVK